MDQLPVLIERLEEELGQPVVENERPQPEAEKHRFHDVLGNLGGAAEPNCELQVLERGNHLPFRFFVGSRRFPKPSLRDRPCGLNPRNALPYCRTPGRTWKFIVYLVQQAPDFNHLGAELLT